MPDQQFIKRFLKLNEISAEMPDAQIVETLENAKWTQDEIQAALMLVRGKPIDIGVVAVSKRDTTLFRSDMSLNSDKLSHLLGVDVVIDPTKMRDVRTQMLVQKRARIREVVVWALVVFSASFLAFVIGWLLIYIMKIGPYHDPHPWI